MELGHSNILVLDFSIFQKCNKRLNHLLDANHSNPNSIKSFSLDLTCKAAVMGSAALHWTDSNLSRENSLKNIFG